MYLCYLYEISVPCECLIIQLVSFSLSLQQYRTVDILQLLHPDKDCVE